ncbi:hypothetical protein LR48_Vigan10g155200 [Vigna angularis]|uniref:Uncharacterized protein n=1 Tax=Phaseolus angularis TaxID=3914 RepID=A0A0L9VKT1_PHAAN|nr:hypothetical protein LR48_Vigan10g155200 [Vigna angularis]
MRDPVESAHCLGNSLCKLVRRVNYQRVLLSVCGLAWRVLSLCDWWWSGTTAHLIRMASGAHSESLGRVGLCLDFRIATWVRYARDPKSDAYSDLIRKATWYFLASIVLHCDVQTMKNKSRSLVLGVILKLQWSFFSCREDSTMWNGKYGEEKRREGTECAKSGREGSRMRESRGKKKKVAKLQEEVLNNGASFPRTIRSSFHFSLRLPPAPPSPHAPFHLRLPSPHASTTPSPFPSILLFMLPKLSNTLRFAPQ